MHKKHFLLKHNSETIEFKQCVSFPVDFELKKTSRLVENFYNILP